VLVHVSEYDRNSWEERWSQALRERGGRVAQRPPNAHLIAEVGDLRPGHALDAGCGHGSDALWLAARGWQVTAVDFAATALGFARSMAEAMGPDVAERIDWVEADLATWAPQRDGYDLVVCLYVHVAGSVEEMVQRMATGSLAAGSCFWLAIVRSTRLRERPGTSRCLSRLRSPPWIRTGGSWSLQMTVRGRLRVPASMPLSKRDAAPDDRDAQQQTAAPGSTTARRPSSSRGATSVARL
jgi:SAM-dependent methyltransferase